MFPLNFSPGPAALPEPLKKRLALELSQPVSFFEISHRHPRVIALWSETKKKILELLQLPSDYQCFLMPGGARLQIAYLWQQYGTHYNWGVLMSGYWGLWAYQQAIIAGARVSAISPMSQTEGFDGLYYCDNETLSGARYKIQRNSMTQWLVVDKTSSLLTAPFDKNEELPDLIIAACQKNLGFSGASLVIAHRRVLTDSQASSLRLPPLDYQLQSHIQNDPCTPSLLHFWTIDAIVDWIQEQGGLQAIDNKRSYWAGKIYQIIDKSPWLINRIPTDHRSTINITFDLTLEAQQRQAELDTALQHVGCYAFRGHPAYAPGYRLSLYNTIACLDLSAVCQVLEDF